MATIYTPNTGLIRGVQHFYTATKPTARPNGSALVVGDRWWKINDGTDWFWNGTYWLSSVRYSTAAQVAGSSLTPASTPGLQYINPSAGQESVFVEYCWLYKTPGATDLNIGNSSTYVRWTWGYFNTTSSYTAFHTKNSYEIDNQFRYRGDVYTAYNIAAFNGTKTVVGLDHTGHRMGVNYRIISP